MKMNRLLFLFFTLVFFTFSSCEKGAGKGGKAKIHVTVINGNLNVAGANLKIKYGATNYSPNVSFDDTGITDTYGDFTFADLRRGDYYIYAMVPDTTSAPLEGGAHVLINNKPGETHVVIDFSEEDPF